MLWPSEVIKFGFSSHQKLFGMLQVAEAGHHSKVGSNKRVGLISLKHSDSWLTLGAVLTNYNCSIKTRLGQEWLFNKVFSEWLGRNISFSLNCLEIPLGEIRWVTSSFCTIKFAITRNNTSAHLCKSKHRAKLPLLKSINNNKTGLTRKKNSIASSISW